MPSDEKKRDILLHIKAALISANSIEIFYNMLSIGETDLKLMELIEKFGKIKKQLEERVDATLNGLLMEWE